MEKTLEIKMKELLDRIEVEISYAKRSDNDCCHDYERRVLEVLDFEKAKLNHG